MIKIDTLKIASHKTPSFPENLRNIAANAQKMPGKPSMRVVRPKRGPIRGHPRAFASHDGATGQSRQAAHAQLLLSSHADNARRDFGALRKWQRKTLGIRF